MNFLNIDCVKKIVTFPKDQNIYRVTSKCIKQGYFLTKHGIIFYGRNLYAQISSNSISALVRGHTKSGHLKREHTKLLWAYNINISLLYYNDPKKGNIPFFPKTGNL